MNNKNCTLTDAVEKYDIDILCKESGEQLMELNDAKAVKAFKRDYLNKEETLEDGIYEGFVNNEISPTVVYVKNNAFGSWKDKIHYDIKLLKNPKKIAELWKES